MLTQINIQNITKRTHESVSFAPSQPIQGQIRSPMNRSTHAAPNPFKRIRSHHH